MLWLVVWAHTDLGIHYMDHLTGPKLIILSKFHGTSTIGMHQKEGSVPFFSAFKCPENAASLPQFKKKKANYKVQIKIENVHIKISTASKRT